MPISLKPHNVETYQKVIDKLKESNKVVVIHPTGTGKMFIALKMLEENNGKKAIYVAPSNPILHDVKKNIFAEGMTMSEFPRLKRITYQKLMRLKDEEIQDLDADVIILDEFHHCGAPEWGRGVERLLQRNEGASVLGLSATPLRYFDGLRDMADELFENNIASEMSLEEAIDREILPEATYVSTLYGYEQELGEMQADIDSMKGNIENKKQAQNLLNELRKKLDENTKNLPELLSEYMQNISGKYIIFCRNIDDMNEKVQQAQKMFGKVNPNITVRAVSSKIRESDKILTEFEQDSEEGTLKLLYAVDMLNEGYHIKDLDGVVMMRPTFSPTVYTQQLGRALTVGGDKKPVVLDLVNNFDSCKIIEDFAEKMKQYKGNEEREKRETKKKSRLSIFDKTKEFREIAEKITELSKKRKVTLEQKIEIFEKFAETGEELVGNTSFEGYPIGQWAIQIRGILNRVNSGKENKKVFNPSKEQLDKLENLGILERQFDSTIDEKIDSLIAWRKKYPKIKIAPAATEEVLRSYAKTDDEYKEIKDEYEKMQRYYDYARYRKYQGKLSEEQMTRGKEGEIGGVFGYPTRIEKLAKKYNVTEKDIDYILTEYDTLDDFYKMYKQDEIKSEYDIELAGKIIKDIVDIDGNSNKNYDMLCRRIYLGERQSKGLILYSSEKLKKLINESFLTDREKGVLERRFKLVDTTKSSRWDSIGQEYGITRERVRQIINKALRKLVRASDKGKSCLWKSPSCDDFIAEEKRKIKNMKEEDLQLHMQNGDLFENLDKLITRQEEIKEIEKDIQLQNGDLYENLKKLETIQEEIKTRKYEEERIAQEKEKEKLKQSIKKQQIVIEELEHFSYEDLLELGMEPEQATKISLEIKEYKNKKAESSIESFNFSIRTYNVLKRAGIKSLIDLANITETQCMQLRNMGKRSLDEIIAKMKELGISFKEAESAQEQQEEIISRKNEEEKNAQEKEDLNIDNFGFSKMTYCGLKRAGVNSLSDLANITEVQCMKFRGIGKRSLDEITAKMKEFGISFKEDENTIAKVQINPNEEPKGKKVKETTAENAKEQQEEIKLEDLTPKQLQEMIDQNQQIIASNEETLKQEELKQELIQRILQQQKIIAEQQSEINRLKSIKSKT